MAIGIVKNAIAANGSGGSSAWAEFVVNSEVTVGGSGISIQDLPANFNELYIKISSSDASTTYASYIIIPKVMISGTTNYMYASGGNHGESSPNGCIVKFNNSSIGVHLYYRSEDINTAYISIYYR